MKKSVLSRIIPIALLTISFTLLIACSDNDDSNDDPTIQTLSKEDKAALLFLLEEEKLARDTYMYMSDLWSINQFTNIKNSEQAHMNSVENLLIENKIEYAILPFGEFKNQTLQELYDQFIVDGKINTANALQIGATIEDLDIVDLQEYLDITTNTDLIAVFENLQCGSRNHLRSFVRRIENDGNTYTPQFMTQEEYNAIIARDNEQCK